MCFVSIYFFALFFFSSLDVFTSAARAPLAPPRAMKRGALTRTAVDCSGYPESRAPCDNPELALLATHCSYL